MDPLDIAPDRNRAGVMPAGIANHLPAIDARQAAWAHATARSLAWAFDGCRMEIRTLRHDDLDCYCGEMLVFRPGPAGRTPRGADAGRLSAALDDAEGLLDRIEGAIGLAAEFTRHGMPARALAGVALIDAEGREMALIAPLDEPLTRAATVPLAAPISAIAARLALAEAEALGGGDLIILNAGAWPVACDLPGFASMQPVFDPRGGMLSPAAFGIGAAPLENGMNDNSRSREITVPITVSLPDLLLSPDQIERLADGGTVALGPVAEGMAVTLSVGGRRLAHGELVTLGDRFAVLIADTAGSPKSTDEASAPRPVFDEPMGPYSSPDGLDDD